MLFGMPESVSATGYEDLAFGVDVINATLYYSDEFTAVITGGWHHKKAYPFSMEYTVVADGGTFEYSSQRGDDVIALRLRRREDGPSSCGRRTDLKPNCSISTPAASTGPVRTTARRRIRRQR